MRLKARQLRTSRFIQTVAQPNNALNPDAPRPADSGFRRSVRSLGAAELKL